MTENKHQQTDIVDSAIEAVRKSSVPAGPSAELVSTLVQVGQNIDENTRLNLNHERRTIMKRVIRAGATMAVTIVAAILVFIWLLDQNGSVAFAEVVAQIRNAKTVTWTYVFVRKESNKDKSKTWHQTDTHKEYFKAPNLIRHERLDKNGNVEHVTIHDLFAGVQVELWPQEKRAKIIRRAPVPKKDRQNIPDRITRLLGHVDGDAVSLGKKKIDGREAIGFHALQRKSDPETSFDLWVDAKTSAPIYFLFPGARKFDPETDPARNNPPGKRFLNGPSALIMRDIVFDSKLDETLFSLQAPLGYSSENKTKHEPTEKDVVEWFGLLAQSYGGLFPEKIRFDIDKFKAMKKKNLTLVERRNLEQANKRIMEHHNQADLGLVYAFPIARFVKHTGGQEWHYAGKGVKLGDKTKAIFWYKPAGSKTFRVIYGDLRVKDVSADKLPLKKPV